MGGIPTIEVWGAPLPNPPPRGGRDLPQSGRKSRIAALRQAWRGSSAAPGAKAQHLPLGVRSMHAHLPGAGLACGVLHEVAAAAHGDRPAAFGFVFALTAARCMRAPAPPCSSPRGARSPISAPLRPRPRPARPRCRPPAADRDRSDKDALWALEESLRSEARPALVAGALAGGLDLTMSRRLNLAAGPHATPLVLLRASEQPARAPRPRAGASPRRRPRATASAPSRPRWHVALERCRNGRPGEWLIEWDHVAHRFRLAESVADRAPAAARRAPPRRLTVDSAPAAGARCARQGRRAHRRAQPGRAAGRPRGRRAALQRPLQGARPAVARRRSGRRCRRPAQAGAVVPALYAARWRLGRDAGADGLFLDITGCAHLFGGEEGLLADLGRRLRAFGLSPRLAVADTAGAAWAVARYGDRSQPFVPPGEERMRSRSCRCRPRAFPRKRCRSCAASASAASAI